MAKVTFDGINRLIVVNTAVTGVNVELDLYSDWKEWATTGSNMRFMQAFRSVAGDPIGAGLEIGAYVFLQNQTSSVDGLPGWRIRPQEAHHTLQLEGNLYPENSALPMLTATLGAFTVLATVDRSSLTQAAITAPRDVWMVASGSYAAGTPGSAIQSIRDSMSRGRLR